MACSMEITALHLKQSALHLWTIALVGMACGHLLYTLEDLFGIPESVASKAEGEKLEVAATFAGTEETPEECEAMIAEGPSSDSGAPLLPRFKRLRSHWLNLDSKTNTLTLKMPLAIFVPQPFPCL